METGLPQAMQMGYQLGWEMSRMEAKGKDPISRFLNMMTASALANPSQAAWTASDDVTDNGVLDALAALMMSRITPGIVSETSTQIDSIKEAIKTGKPLVLRSQRSTARSRWTKTTGSGTGCSTRLMKDPVRETMPTGSIPTGK